MLEAAKGYGLTMDFEETKIKLRTLAQLKSSGAQEALDAINFLEGVLLGTDIRLRASEKLRGLEANRIYDKAYSSGVIYGKRESEWRCAKLEAALHFADAFIESGIDLGFVNMPEDLDDPAHAVPKIIKSALIDVEKS